MVQDLVLSGLVDRLAQNYRVVCFDRPGFGYSHRPRTRIWTATRQAALFAKALDQLGVRNPVVLGHAGGDRAGATKRLCREWAGACVRLLFSNRSDGLLAHVSSGNAAARRSDALH